MKKTLFLCLTIFAVFSFSACTSNNDKKTEVEKVEVTAMAENFDWLLGSWKRINDEEGNKTFEVWNKESDTAYYGHGYTLQDKDTISQERITLIKSDKRWRVGVIGTGETTPTVFEVTSIEKDRFVCENPAIVFPKKIQYWKEGDNIKATVAGDDMEISFEFEKIK